MKQQIIFIVCVVAGWACSTVSAQTESPSHEIPPHADVAASLKRIDSIVAGGPFAPNWKSLEGYEIPQWYKDAKLGIFVHWGAYSVPAFGSEWYPRQMYIDRERRGDNFFKHHLENYGPQNKFGYKDFIPMFKAERFDPNEWAELFAKAGAKYVVPVAEHHDGFPMYACKFTEWDASKKGPRRDVIEELQKAIRARGMKFGVSSHRAFNWMYYVRQPHYDNANPRFAGLYGRPMPFLFQANAPDYKEFFPPQDTQFKDDWLARTCELVDRFHPDLMWFDFGITAKEETSYSENHYSPYLQRYAAYYYNVTRKSGRDIGVINYKWKAFPEKAAVLDLERSKMDAIRQPFWQTDTAVSSSSWGYTKNQKYKSPNRLVDDLVDIVSKNGCLLLNVGPRADGTIPEEDQALLLSIGKWLELNGEAIYATKFWKIHGEGPTGTATGHLAEHKDKPFTSRDIRFTSKPGVLYATLLDWPTNGVATIKALRKGSPHWHQPIESIELIGSDKPIDWRRTTEGLRVDLPKTRPCEFAYVLKIR